MSFTKKFEYYGEEVWEWNLPTGWTCPFASACLVKVDRESGSMDDRSSEFKCYAGAAERFPGVRDSRWENFEIAKKGRLPRLPHGAKRVRIHASGDFFSQAYFDLWLKYCRHYVKVEFWAYTKSLKYWIARLNEIPPNLVLTASTGGKHDHLIKEHDLKHVVVVKDRAEAKEKGLPVCWNDREARYKNINFALIDNFN